jgi:hypothetical protein
VPLHSWLCAERRGLMAPGAAAFAALCGETRPDGAGRRRIRGLVRKNAEDWPPSTAPRSQNRRRACQLTARSVWWLVVFEYDASELGAVGYVQLDEDVGEVGLDRRQADQHLSGDVSVREAAGDVSGDSQFCG